MQTRQEQLMVILAQSQGWLKGRDLAALLGVSDRTIRSDMNKLKQDYPGAIQTHHHKGYRLVSQVLEAQSSGPASESGRKATLFTQTIIG